MNARTMPIGYHYSGAFHPVQAPVVKVIAKVSIRTPPNAFWKVYSLSIVDARSLAAAVELNFSQGRL